MVWVKISQKLQTLVCGCICVLLSPWAYAQFEIRPNVISGGGGQGLTAGNFELAGTVGQVGAGGELRSDSGRFSLSGGFWRAAAGSTEPQPLQDRDGDGFQDTVDPDPDDPAVIPPLGDVDRDGKATLKDAMLLYRASRGQVSLSIPLDRGDLDRDGDVDPEDARILYEWVTGSPDVQVIPVK